jgi:glycosyltransferase involved in cell wall biosynthesis
VIPVWDAYAGDGLLEALASVERQSVPVEIIVVDNASEVDLPPLRDAQLVRLDARCSTGAARNAALERLRTPYVVFLDADDLLLDGALMALTMGLDGDERRSAYVLSIVDGVTAKRYRSPRRFVWALCRLPTVFALANTVWSLLPTQGCTIMRVSDVRACGGYGDHDPGEDWVLGTSVAFRGKVSFDRRPGLVYRRREDSPGVRALSAAALLDNARAVRARVSEDSGVPRWVKSVLPLIAVAQWCAARIAHPLYRSCRAVLTGGGPAR